MLGFQSVKQTTAMMQQSWEEWRSKVKMIMRASHITKKRLNCCNRDHHQSGRKWEFYVERKRRRSLEGRELGEDLRHLDVVVVVDRICFSIADLQLLLLLLLKNSNFLTAELAIPTASINCSFLLALMIWVFFRLLPPWIWWVVVRSFRLGFQHLCFSGLKPALIPWK